MARLIGVVRRMLVRPINCSPKTRYSPFLCRMKYSRSVQSMACGSGKGELVLTTLSKYAMPMIRYRTHDITSIIPEPCSCGRTLRRIRRIGRRSDDMFIIRGVNVFPSQIETALLSVEGTLPHYQIVLSRHQGLDEMEVQVEITGKMFAEIFHELREMLHGKGRENKRHTKAERINKEK